MINGGGNSYKRISHKQTIIYFFNQTVSKFVLFVSISTSPHQLQFRISGCWHSFPKLGKMQISVALLRYCTFLPYGLALLPRMDTWDSVIIPKTMMCRASTSILWWGSRSGRLYTDVLLSEQTKWIWLMYTANHVHLIYKRTYLQCKCKCISEGLCKLHSESK